jgi:hypothetical protein
MCQVYAAYAGKRGYWHKNPYMEDKIKWLRKYAQENREHFFDVTDVRLCDAWNDAFGLEKRALGRFLAQAYRAGHLTRGIIGIQSGYWNNPRWVYSYSFCQ